MIRVGIIGLGKIAQTKYLPYLLSFEQAELVAVCDQSQSLTEKVVRAYRLRPETECCVVEELIEHRPDLVFVLTHDHYEISMQLMEAHISICIEKPVCWSSEQILELSKAAKEKQVFIYALYMKQYDPAFQAFCRLIREQGAPLSLQVSCFAGNNKKWCDPQYQLLKEAPEEKKFTKQSLNTAWDQFYENTRREQKRSEGQLLLQLGIHQLNLIHQLLGELRPVQVLCHERNHLQTIHALFENGEGVPIHYTLIPLFSADWLWQETYEAVYADQILRYRPGSPFLKTSESVLDQVFGENGAMKKQTLRFGTEEPFGMMIREILDRYQNAQEDDSLEQALRDLETIESILAME